MKNKTVLFLLLSALTLQSCATILGGNISECQRRRPESGEPKRQIRPVALAADIVCDPIICLPVDFLTGAIYKPCNDNFNGSRYRNFDDGFRIKGSNEFYVGTGYASLTQIRGWVGPPLLTNFISQPSLHTGAAFLTYRHFLSERFAIGVSAGIDNEGGYLSYGNPEISPTGSDANSGQYNIHAYTLAVEGLFVYKKTHKNMTYGYLGIGGTSFDDKCTIFANAPYGSPVPLPSNPYDYHVNQFNFQVTPIGYRFGGTVAGFFEIGFGYKGIFSGGLSVRL